MNIFSFIINHPFVKGKFPKATYIKDCGSKEAKIWEPVGTKIYEKFETAYTTECTNTRSEFEQKKAKIIDEFYCNYVPFSLYRTNGGKYIAVKTVDIDGNSIPAFWWEIERKEPV